MSLLGFTAELALYRPSGKYRSGRTAGEANSSVTSPSYGGAVYPNLISCKQICAKLVGPPPNRAYAPACCRCQGGIWMGGVCT
jgi:hypothetical protein